MQYLFKASLGFGEGELSTQWKIHRKFVPTHCVLFSWYCCPSSVCEGHLRLSQGPFNVVLITDIVCLSWYLFDRFASWTAGSFVHHPWLPLPHGVSSILPSGADTPPSLISSHALQDQSPWPLSQLQMTLPTSLLLGLDSGVRNTSWWFLREGGQLLMWYLVFLDQVVI